MGKVFVVLFAAGAASFNGCDNRRRRNLASTTAFFEILARIFHPVNCIVMSVLQTRGVFAYNA
ncbi:MAG: hypothetical protein U9Q61_05960 [Thermodesulfobacteriota bacterium]|nr:hypothetical protein [Thermodesulfobacteriota bacterium]